MASHLGFFVCLFVSFFFSTFTAFSRFDLRLFKGVVLTISWTVFSIVFIHDPPFALLYHHLLWEFCQINCCWYFNLGFLSVDSFLISWCISLLLFSFMHFWSSGISHNALHPFCIGTWLLYGHASGPSCLPVTSLHHLLTTAVPCLSLKDSSPSFLKMALTSLANFSGYFSIRIWPGPPRDFSSWQGMLHFYRQRHSLS